MAKLPEISDLVNARTNLGCLQSKLTDLQAELNTARKALLCIEKEVIQRYKSANISEKDCNHPVIEYLGMGETQCACCGKYRV